MKRKDNSKLWALVINSTRARILRGFGTEEDAPPLDELVLKSEARNLRDIMSDKPGREFSSGSLGRRSAMEYASDPVDEDRRDFVRQVLATLESHRLAGDFVRLAIFAEHDVLGILRQMMTESLHGLVVCEVPKNLLHLPTPALRAAIMDEMSKGSELA